MKERSVSVYCEAAARVWLVNYKQHYLPRVSLVSRVACFIGQKRLVSDPKFLPYIRKSQDFGFALKSGFQLSSRALWGCWRGLEPRHRGSLRVLNVSAKSINLSVSFPH